MTIKLTDDQITMVFERAVGMPPRAADLAIVKIMDPTGPNIEDVAEYIWDHWMGEPDEPSLETVTATITEWIKEESK